MKKIICFILLLLISNSALSQIKMTMRVVIDRDTIRLRDGQTIADIYDSINSSNLMIYKLERERIEDSTDRAYFLRIKNGPHLYYNIDRYNNFIESDPELIDGLIKEEGLIKLDTIINYSDINYEVMSSINSFRVENSVSIVEIDSLSQEDFIESTIIPYYYLKSNSDKKNAVIEIVYSERCQTECYKEVYEKIKSKKYLKKIFLDDNIEYMNISTIKDKSSVITFVRYKVSGEKEKFKIFYIR